MRILRAVDGVVFGLRRPRPDQGARFPQASLPRRQRRGNGKGVVPRAARWPGVAGFRGLSILRAARAGNVVAGAVVLSAASQPPCRPSALQLDRLAPNPAVVDDKPRPAAGTVRHNMRLGSPLPLWERSHCIADAMRVRGGHGGGPRVDAAPPTPP